MCKGEYVPVCGVGRVGWVGWGAGVSSKWELPGWTWSRRGIIPTTHQMDVGVESLFEVMPGFYGAHAHTKHRRRYGVKGQDCPALCTT